MDPSLSGKSAEPVYRDAKGLSSLTQSMTFEIFSSTFGSSDSTGFVVLYFHVSDC